MPEFLQSLPVSGGLCVNLPGEIGFCPDLITTSCTGFLLVLTRLARRGPELFESTGFSRIIFGGFTRPPSHSRQVVALLIKSGRSG